MLCTHLFWFDAGFGRFQLIAVMILGWANSADAIEVLCVSFILPYASCELKATDLELGFLTAVGFAGIYNLQLQPVM